MFKIWCKLFGHNVKYSNWFGGERKCECCGKWIKSY